MWDFTRELLRRDFDAFFEQFPEVEAVTWAQTVDDGVFGVDGIIRIVKGSTVYSGAFLFPGTPEIDGAEAILYSYPFDVMRDLFGEDTQVTVTRESMQPAGRMAS